jgi:hypothetical protein
MAAALFLSTLLKSSHQQLIQFRGYEMKDSEQDIRLMNLRPMSRRRFVTGIGAGTAIVGLGLGSGLSLASTSKRPGPTTLKGNQVDLHIAYEPVNFTGKNRMATAINGSVPGPTLRWREGDRATIRVKNNLAEDSSIHWRYYFTCRSRWRAWH